MTQGVPAPYPVYLGKVDEVWDMEDSKDVPAVVMNIVIEEQAHLTLCSDRCCDPTAPGYDMGLLLATDDEAILHPDHAQWLEAMQTKLKMMKDMNMYRVACLPQGRKAIGCHWVLEFREDNKGGSIYKTRLIAQGFSQVLGVDYGVTFTLVIKPASVCLLVALTAQYD